MAGGGRWKWGVTLSTWLALAAAGCGMDVFDVDIDLAPQTFTLDFGQQSGTVPAIACNDAIVQEAGQLEGLVTPLAGEVVHPQLVRAQAPPHSASMPALPFLMAVSITVEPVSPSTV